MKRSFEKTFQRQGVAQGQLTVGITDGDETGVVIVSKLRDGVAFTSLHCGDQRFLLVIPQLQSTVSIGEAHFVFERMRVQGEDC